MATFQVMYNSEVDPNEDLGIQEKIGFEVYAPRSFNSGRVFNNWTDGLTEVEIPETRWNSRKPMRFRIYVGSRKITAQARVLRPTSIELSISKNHYIEEGIIKVLGQLKHAEPKPPTFRNQRTKTYKCELSCPGMDKKKVGQGVCITCKGPKIEFELCC